MRKVESVEEFISHFPERKKDLETLRSIVLECGLEEAIKWSAPVYMLDGKNVIGLLAFKSYIGLWFHQGALLRDDAKVLINAQEGVTKALRQWRIGVDEKLDPDLIKAYVLEAIKNERAGRRVKIEKKKALEIPEELNDAFHSNDGLQTAFEAFTEYKRREFAEFIGSAKREATRLNRLKKCIPMILEGVGLNDKYR